VFLYVPLAQAVHSTLFGPVYPSLQSQDTSAELPLGETELVGHVKHVVSSVAATVVEYFPIAQATQFAVAVVPEYFPAKQFEHDKVPLLDLKVPMAHAEHALLSGPVYPGLQRQAVADIQLSPVTHEAPLFCGQALHGLFNVGLQYPLLHLHIVDSKQYPFTHI
jgi:hypothetical protein